MSFANFIPTVESIKLAKQIEKKLVMAQHVNREYEGEVKQAGDSVRILCVNKPTIYTINDKTTSGTKAANAGEGTGRDVIQGNIGDAEQLADSSITMQINQISYFHYSVGDIDYAQASAVGKRAWKKRRAKAAQGLADAMDNHIASVYRDSKCDVPSTLYASTKKLVAGEAGSNEVNILDFIDGLVEIFNKREITDKTTLYMECSPTFWKVLKKAYRDLDTNNSALLKGRALGIYNDVQIIKTTSCYNGSDDYIFIHTDDATAFANPLTKTEAYRPEKAFSDAVKGFTLYDAKVIYPQELLVSKVTF